MKVTDSALAVFGNGESLLGARLLGRNVSVVRCCELINRTQGVIFHEDDHSQSVSNNNYKNTQRTQLVAVDIGHNVYSITKKLMAVDGCVCGPLMWATVRCIYGPLLWARVSTFECVCMTKIMLL